MFIEVVAIGEKCTLMISGSYIYMMDGSKNSKSRVQYAVTATIILYFILAFYPKYLGDGKEIIPFSLYNLYSLVPYDYTYMDLLIIDECDTKKFLFYNNKDLNSIERKYFLRWLNGIRNVYQRTQQIDIDIDDKILRDLKGEVYLVKLTGDYIETLDKGTFDSEIVARIK